MNLSQMHERLRVELLRRIQRGTLSVSLLARQTGFGPSHLSNFLHQKRQLSLEGVDRILAAQHMGAADLMPVDSNFEAIPMEDDASSVPIVSHASALFEPLIRPSAALAILHLPANSLKSLRSRASATRRMWHRFVAVRISAADALPMDPVLLPEALAVLDRHYHSLAPYRPNRPSLYAVRNGPRLNVRYLDFLANRLILRPHNTAYPVDLLTIEPGGSPNDLIAGRVVLILNET